MTEPVYHSKRLSDTHGTDHCFRLLNARGTPGETRSLSARINLVIGLTDEAIQALAERAEDTDAILHVTC